MPSFRLVFRKESARRALPDLPRVLYNLTLFMSSSNRRVASPGSSSSSATETLNILHDLSRLLNTGLDRATLATCVRMIEGGANPEALAAVVKELRRENAALPQRPTADDG